MRQHIACMPLPEESSLKSGCMLTEYQAKFFAHSAKAIRESKKPKDEYQPLEGKMANMTIFRSDYVSHKVTRRPPKVPMAYVPPEESMEHTTTYVHDYHAHSIPQKIMMKTLVYNPPSVKMVTESTYKEEFQSWDTVMQLPLRTSGNPKPSHARIDVTSTSQDNYCSKNSAAQKNLKPNPSDKESPPFESTTTYRLQYVSHPVQPRQSKQRALHKPNSTPLNRVTTHKHDCQCLQGEVGKPIRSKANWESNPTPFDGCTEFQDKYRTWPVKRNKQHRILKYCSPRGEMDFTFKANFEGHQTQPLPSMHSPIQVSARDKVPSKSCSTMKADNRALEAKKGIQVVWHKDTGKPVGAFENGTTVSSQNTFKTTVQPPGFKPVQKATTLHCMQDSRVCCTTYATKEIQQCPSTLNAQKGFEHRDATAEGGQPSCTLIDRESCIAHSAMTNCNKPNDSHGHGHKEQATESTILCRDKRTN